MNAYGARISDLPEATTVEADDWLPIVSQVRTTNGTRKITAPNLLKAGGKILFVDGTNGVDAQGTRGSHLGFKTLTAAKTAAQSGDLIVVYPGTYAENNILKEGVTWHFMAGANVDYTDPATAESPGYGILDDRPTGPVTCAVRGQGKFIWRTPLVGYGEALEVSPPNESVLRGIMFIGEEDSDIYFEAAGMFMSTLLVKFAMWVEDGQVSVLCPKVIDLLYGITTTLGDFGGPVTAESQAGALYWGIGEMHLTVEHIKMTQYCLWPEQPSGFAGSANLWVTADKIESRGDNSSAIYISEQVGAASQNYRTWIVAKEIIVNTGGFGGYSCYARGRHYLTAQKVSNALADGIGINSANGGECWITVQKISGGPTSNSLRLFASNTMTVHLDETHIEDGAAGIRVEGGTLEMRGGLCKQANGKGIVHAGGTSIIRGMRFDTSATNGATNRPVEVSSSGLILDGCTLVAPALADSMFAGSAQNVKVYGTTFANKAKHANVTIQVGTLTVDANVT